MSTPIYISQARLLDPAAGRDTFGALFIDAQGRIAEPPEHLEGVRIVDRPGLIVMPGCCDVHVHFRDPGNTAAEDLFSGSEAAACGGFTRVVTMPNTTPATDSPELIRRARKAQTAVSIYPAACCTKGRAGQEPANLEALAEAGAACFTDDGSMVANPDVMRQVMRRAKALGRVVMDHAVRPDIQNGGVIRACPVQMRFNLPVFPAEAEVQAVRDDLARCRETGCRLHIQHLSCAESVALIRAAQKEGLPVSAEATPHHIALCAEEIPGDNGNWRMNPPLGTHADVEALREGLCDGTLALFATDHAPHTPTSKANGFLKAPFGIIGLETALPVTWNVMVRSGLMSPLAWCAAWNQKPNALLGLPQPVLKLGETAELTLFDPEAEWIVSRETLKSKSLDTPWLGQPLRGRALATIRNGQLYGQLPE